MTLFQRVTMTLMALTVLSLQVVTNTGCAHGLGAATPDTSIPSPTQLPALARADATPTTPSFAAGGLHKPAGVKHFVVEVTLRGEINDDAAKSIAPIVEAVNASHHDPSQDPVEAVVFIIDTPGGSMMAGTVIAEELQGLETPLVCVVDSHAYSMGFFLLENVCPVRLATSRASLMVHEPHFSGDVTLNNPKRGDFQSISESLRVETEAWLARCAERMDLSLAELAARIRGQEWWLTADEALKAHAVDGVVTSIGRDVERPLERDLKLPSGIPLQLP
jgi:ATP-dependent Clp protease protease subunit